LFWINPAAVGNFGRRDLQADGGERTAANRQPYPNVDFGASPFGALTALLLESARDDLVRFAVLADDPGDKAATP
jgi:hypothetical protein